MRKDSETRRDHAKATLLLEGSVHNNSSFKSRLGAEFDMKYHILHDFKFSTSFKEKSSEHFKDLHKLKLLTSFDVNLISLPGRLTNLLPNSSFSIPPRNDVRLK